MTTKLELNRVLRVYTKYQDEQLAHDNMQLEAFKLADYLLSKGTGAVAQIDGLGEYFWVSPYKNMLEIVCSPDLDLLKPHQNNVFLVRDFDGLGVVELDNISNEITKWFKSPEVIFEDQISLNNILNHTYAPELAFTPLGGLHE